MSKRLAKKAVKNKYHCRHCGVTVKRESDKAWINSFCATTGKDVRIMKVK